MSATNNAYNFDAHAAQDYKEEYSEVDAEVYKDEDYEEEHGEVDTETYADEEDVDYED
jgi:hypothetical protein